MFPCDNCGKLSEALLPVILWDPHGEGAPQEICSDCYDEMKRRGADLSFDIDDDDEPPPTYLPDHPGHKELLDAVMNEPDE